MNIESRILIYEKNGNNLKPIKIYFDSSGRKWIESHEGTKFVIEIKNNDYNTYLAIVSVDGLNVLDASKAELKPNNGYVLYSKKSMKINGWRTSLDDVREFVFTSDKNESYAHKLGANESNTGVIGLAFFKEIVVPTITMWPPNNWNSTSYTVASASTVVPTNLSANLRSMSMSTAQGSLVEDKVTEVEKQFENTVSFIDTIYYDNRENLIAKGIIKEETEKLPEPFANSRFCPSL